jgi:hypothetical protein
MNIVEAYIKFNGQLIILISGLSGCGKLALAKNISRDFKIKLLDQHNYYKKDYNVVTSLPDGTKIINWYTDDAIDWEKFNGDINNNKKDGVVVIGMSFPIDKLKFDPDYHVHLNINKQLCLEKRKEFLEKHKEEYADEYKIINTPTEKLIMNQFIFPYDIESNKNSKINKFVNINNLSDDQVYDIVYDLLKDFIQKYLNHHDATTEAGAKTPKVSKVSRQDSSDTISASIELLDEPQYLYDRNSDMFEEYSDEDDKDDEKEEEKSE